MAVTSCDVTAMMPRERLRGEVCASLSLGRAEQSPEISEVWGCPLSRSLSMTSGDKTFQGVTGTSPTSLPETLSPI